MKAVVLEIKGKKAAVLSRDGVFRVVDDKGYRVGDEINIKAKSNVLKPVFKALCAAAAVVICSVGGYCYAAPYSYVSIDINPSIEYTLNRFDRVLSVRAVNDDGEKIVGQIDKLSVFNRPIEQAVEITVNELCQSEYVLPDDENVVIVAAASSDEQRSQQLAQRLEQSVSAVDAPQNMDIRSMSVSKERLEQAHKMGVSAGKLELVEQLAEQSGAEPLESLAAKTGKNKPEKAAGSPEEKGQNAFSREEWLKKPVREVVSEINRQKDKKSGGQKQNAEQSAVPDDIGENIAPPQYDNEQPPMDTNRLLPGDDNSGKNDKAHDPPKGAGVNNAPDKFKEKLDENAEKIKDRAENKAEEIKDKAEDKAQQRQQRLEEKEQRKNEIIDRFEQKAEGKAQKAAGKKSFADRLLPESDESVDDTQEAGEIN